MRPVYQGYADVLHGGVVATLMDGAMTNCLFAHRIVAVTAELTVRYLFPVHTGQRVTVKAWITKSSRHLHLLAAELTQDGKIYAKALGKFRKIKTVPDQHSSQA